MPALVSYCTSSGRHTGSWWSSSLPSPASAPDAIVRKAGARFGAQRGELIPGIPGIAGYAVAGEIAIWFVTEARAVPSCELIPSVVRRGGQRGRKEPPTLVRWPAVSYA